MSWDPVWEEVYRSRAWGQYPGEDVVRFVAGNFYPAKDRAQVRLLEVGSGAGANLWFMAREGFCVHGVEGSETAVRLSRQRLDSECPDWQSVGGRVQVGDMARLPYPDAYFDAVLDVVAACYSSFDKARQIYSELARVSKPGARLFSRTFARGCWGDGTGRQVDQDMWLCSEGHLKGFGATRFTDEAAVPDLLQGWQVDRVERASLTEEGGRHELKYLLMYGTRAP
jgi:SAM-dependent methyltransferase